MCFLRGPDYHGVSPEGGLEDLGAAMVRIDTSFIGILSAMLNSTAIYCRKNTTKRAMMPNPEINPASIRASE